MTDYSFLVEERQSGARNGNLWGPFTEYEAWGHVHRMTNHARNYGNHYNLTYHVRYVHNRPQLAYTGEQVAL